MEEVEAGEVQLLNTSVISVDPGYALVEVEAEVLFKAQVSYDDSSTGYYDSEDGDWFGQDRVNARIKRSQIVTAELELSWDPQSGIADDLKISLSSLSPRDVRVKVNRDGHPYK